jgi:DNA gyrase subunit A
MGRATQGVRIIKLRENDSIAAVARVPAASLEETEEGIENTNENEATTEE